MSIATDARIKVLEGLVADLAKRVVVLESRPAHDTQALLQPLNDLPAFARRGRPPKNAQETI